MQLVFLHQHEHQKSSPSCGLEARKAPGLDETVTWEDVQMLQHHHSLEPTLDERRVSGCKRKEIICSQLLCLPPGISASGLAWADDLEADRQRA